MLQLVIIVENISSFCSSGRPDFWSQMKHKLGQLNYILCLFKHPDLNCVLSHFVPKCYSYSARLHGLLSWAFGSNKLVNLQ